MSRNPKLARLGRAILYVLIALMLIPLLFSTTAPTASATQDNRTPTKDAYITEHNPDTNYNNEELASGARTGSNAYYRSYLQFSVENISSDNIVTSAKLWLKLYSIQAAHNDQLWGIDNTVWSETGITWNNKPAAGQENQQLDNNDMSATGWYSWDVTGWVENHKGENVTFMLRGEESGYVMNYSTYRSNDYGTPSDRPYLEVSYTPEVRTITIESITVDNSLIDRDNDGYSEGGLATLISATIYDNAGRDAIIFDNTKITIYSADNATQVNSASFDNYDNVDENRKRFNYAYNPSDALGDGTLGNFSVKVYTNDNINIENTYQENNLFWVDDFVLPAYAENLSGHQTHIYGNAAMGGSDNVPEDLIIVDTNFGTYTTNPAGDNSWENTYDAPSTGNFYAWTLENGIDGKSDTVSYAFPNFAPEVISVDVDNSLIDRDMDYAGSGADTDTIITVRFRDNDNDTLDFWLAVRDVLDALVDNENVTSTASYIADNQWDVTMTYDATDNTLADAQLGAWDIWTYAADAYGGTISDWQASKFTVDDLASTISFSPTSPYYGWDLTVSGTISRISGAAASADNSWYIDENHGTTTLGSGNSWSHTFTITLANPSENVSVILRAKDYPLDGENNLSYLVNENMIYQIEVRWENDYSLVPNAVFDNTFPDNYENIIDRNWVVKFNWDGGTQENTLSSNPENIIIVSEGEIPFLIALNDNDNYWRRRIPTGGGGILTFVLPEDNATIYQYTMTITDYTDLFDTPDGWVSLRMYIDNSFAIINDDWWDATNHAYAYLQLHEWYEVYLFNQTGSQRHIGHIQAETTTTLDPFVAVALEFGENKVFKYEVLEFEATRDNVGYVVMRFRDTNDNTDNIVWRIYTLDNTLMYTAEFAYPSEIEATWVGADNDNTYKMEIVVSSREFGTWSEWYIVGPIITPLPYTAPGVGSILGTLMPLAGLAGLFFIGVIAMSFGARYASTAMLGVAVGAIFLKYLSYTMAINLMPLSEGALILLLVMAIAWNVGERL